MSNHLPTFLKRLRGITLSDNERLAMRERLAVYADMHPALASTPVSGFFGFFAAATSRYASAYASALAILIVVGGGVAFAADTSVPGDTLYALKIHVNEPVMAALAPTPVGQARVAATLATRRVDEAVTLAQRGQLTPERQSYLTHEFAAGVRNAALKANALAATGDAKEADTVRADLAANLAGQAQALGAVTTKDSAASAALLHAVVATSEDISENAGDAAVATLTTPSDETDATTSVAAAVPAEPEEGGVHTAALMAAKSMATTSATTTAQKRVAAPRLNKQLRVASSTFEGRLGSTTYARFIPRVDIAIPRISVPFFPSSDSSQGTGETDTGND